MMYIGSTPDIVPLSAPGSVEVQSRKAKSAIILRPTISTDISLIVASCIWTSTLKRGSTGIEGRPKAEALKAAKSRCP